VADLLEAPLYIQGASYPGSADRSLIRLLSNGAAIGTPADLAVTANGTPNMSVNVAAGHAVVPRSGGSFGDAYTAENQSSPQNLTIAAADPTNPRYDWIIVKIYDAAYSGSLNKGTLEVVTGVASATPARPTIAAGTSYVLLAELYVTAGKTSIVSGDITDKRPAAFAAPGGVVTVVNQAARDALPLTDGLQVYRLDTHVLETYSNGAWLSDTGWVNITSFGTGWSAGGYAPQVRRIGNVVYLTGVLNLGASAGTPMLTLPSWAQPTAVRWLPAQIVGSGSHQIYQLIVNTDGTIPLPSSYLSASFAANTAGYPIAGSYAI
jgi:hypothetical protein